MKIVIHRLVEVDWLIIQNIDIFVHYGIFPFTTIQCFQINASLSLCLSLLLPFGLPEIQKFCCSLVLSSSNNLYDGCGACQTNVLWF